MQLTAVYKKFPQGYAAFVEELPGANTQGGDTQRSPQEPGRGRKTCLGS